MINRIIQHEWRALLADKTVWLLSALLFVTISYGLWNGASWASFRGETVTRAQAEEKQRLAGLQNRVRGIEAGAPVPEHHSPTDATMMGLFDAARYALLPPAPLSLLSVGQSDLYPPQYKITAQGKNTWTNSDEIENPVNLLAGRFDMSFVVIYLMPLCILALSFNLLSAEREGGTLPMLLSQGVSLSQLLWGKTLARFTVLLAIFLVFTFGALAFHGVFGTAGTGVISWIALVTLYAAFWFALALAVNAWGKSSASNAMTLLACWLACVLIIPSVVGVIASTLYPVPSRLELIQASRDAAAESAAQNRGVLAKYYEDHPEFVPKAARPTKPDAYLNFFAVQEMSARRVEPLLAQYDIQLEKQQNVVNGLRFLSPAILTQEAM
ncbi:DUF3526 domain-containing protein, partial [bacterium]